jgi:hypothetical protein
MGVRTAAMLAMVALAGSAGLYPVTKPAPTDSQTMLTGSSSANLSAYPDAVPDKAINLLFIHHSVGGQLLADTGAALTSAEDRLSIHRIHPNGGGLRAQLQQRHYVVHEASYSSVIGENTDLFDWLPKFRSEMPRILGTAHQDQLLGEGKNQVVLFKSCFPNSAFKTDRPGVGNPAGPVLTLSNAKATLSAVRDELARQPDVLFVYLTAPPLRAHETSEPLWKYAVKRILGRATSDVEQIEAAADARAFNNWVTSPEGWLKGYAGRNIVVFDYYDVLTGGGASNFLKFPSAGGKDDHPSAEGQHIAATRLVAFLNRAVRYAGVVN